MRNRICSLSLLRCSEHFQWFALIWSSKINHQHVVCWLASSNVWGRAVETIQNKIKINSRSSSNRICSIRWWVWTEHRWKKSMCWKSFKLVSNQLLIVDSWCAHPNTRIEHYYFWSNHEFGANKQWFNLCKFI